MLRAVVSGAWVGEDTVELVRVLLCKSEGGLVAPFFGRGRGELACALMAEEIVAGEDVVDLEALGARKALADVALQQTLAVDDAGSLSIAEQRPDRGTLARLAAGGGLHGCARVGSAG